MNQSCIPFGGTALQSFKPYTQLEYLDCMFNCMFEGKKLSEVEKELFHKKDWLSLFYYSGVKCQNYITFK